MLFSDQLSTAIKETVLQLFQCELPHEKIVLQPTRKEFAGDVSLVTFGIAAMVNTSPDNCATLIGNYLHAHYPWIESCTVIKGFLNISLQKKLFIQALQTNEIDIPSHSNNIQNVVIEYSSPNTNKPLHLGHVRNILLGYSLAKIYEACGHTVHKVNIVNDRGIHICKSMLAWQLYGNGETPISTAMKGDKLVGKYYVEFDKQYNAQAKLLLEQWQQQQFENSNISTKVNELYTKLQQAEKPELKEKIKDELKDFAKAQTTIFKDVQQMLRNWENGDKPTLELWRTMNNWVYQGFDITYKNLGVDFDKIYYESDTYLLGKDIVALGLANQVFYKKDDGSVWVDLTDEGLDHKLLLRSDGTSVYITQDLGTASLRYHDYHFHKMIYVVGNEQEYHFKVLKLIFKKLQTSWWQALQHFSYNMVDLPSGKMKSREGTVVDADDLIAQTINEASILATTLGKIEGMPPHEQQQLFYQLGMGALKFYILKVDPEKRMLFNPAESIDINGFTGPFVQYTYARIQSLLRKASAIPSLAQFHTLDWNRHTPDAKEMELIKQILQYKLIVPQAAEKLSPALIANYAYDTAKTFNQFYHHHIAVDANDLTTSAFRLLLAHKTANILRHAFHLLGIEMPARM